MANQFATDYNKKPLSGGHAPMGYNESYTVLANGLGVADKVYFGIIPAGVEINDVALIHGADADATLSLGYEPANPGEIAAANTYWLNAQALATAGRKSSQAFPVTFKFDVVLVGTVGGGAITNGTQLTVVTDGKGIGV